MYMSRKSLIITLLVVIVSIIAVYLLLPQTTKAPSTAKNTASSQNLEFAVVVDSPTINSEVTSPVTLSGKAPGTWYFEASAPVLIKDSTGKVLGSSHIKAQGDWMTPNYVPFVGTLTFSKPSTKTGTLIFKNDNPSGDPAKQKTLEILVQF